MDKNMINIAYNELDSISNDIFNSLFRFSNDFNYKIGYYNYHYFRDNNKYLLEYYPIPVITIEGLCDIEIDFNQIRIVSKLPLNKALEYDFYKINDYDFEIYELNDYLKKLYKFGDSIEGLMLNLKQIDSDEIGITRYFENKEIIDLLDYIYFIKNEGFYY